MGTRMLEFLIEIIIFMDALPEPQQQSPAEPMVLILVLWRIPLPSNPFLLFIPRGAFADLHMCTQLFLRLSSGGGERRCEAGEGRNILLAGHALYLVHSYM